MKSSMTRSHSQALVAPRIGPERVAIADPCQERELPSTGGVEGVLPDAALRAQAGAEPLAFSLEASLPVTFSYRGGGRTLTFTILIPRARSTHSCPRLPRCIP